MCSDYRLRVELVGIEAALAQAGMRVAFPEGRPNIAPRDDIRITDRAPILRTGTDGPELVQRRWSWPGRGGRPVYNVRSDGHGIAGTRCLVIADGFYEFTVPVDPKAKRKHKWLFQMTEANPFAIAGVWRADPNVGEAFSLLTIAAGPDIAPFHGRQIVALPPVAWSRWLDRATVAADVLIPSPAGSLTITQIA